MSTRFRASRMLAIGLLVAAVLAVLPAYAASSVVEDPSGDAAPAYVDISKAKVTEQQGQGSLFFMQEMAGAVPVAPPQDFINWIWNLDTRPGSPGGMPWEYVVSVEWTGNEFRGLLNDRTQGAQPVRTPIRFSVNGATVKAYVDRAQLGNPSSFRWRAVTRTVQQAPEAPADTAPPAPSLAIWSE